MLKVNAMKRYFTLSLMFLCLTGLFFACDKIDGDYTVIPSNAQSDVSFPEVNPGEVYRKMLIEEFTGHRCTNCPMGHQILETLHSRYGDTLVAVGIHYGALAKPVGSTFNYDFRTEKGTRLGDYYVIDAIPSAIVNRNYKEGGWSRELWGNQLAEVDRSQVYAALQLINQYDASKKTLKTNAKVTMLKDYPNPLSLVVYLLEDGIVKPQKDGNQDIEDYVHNHVLRKTVTDDILSGYKLNMANAMNAGDSDTFAASVGFSDTDWVPENCYVVAFVLDATTQEVLQVETLNVVGQ